MKSSFKFLCISLIVVSCGSSSDEIGKLQDENRKLKGEVESIKAILAKEKAPLVTTSLPETNKTPLSSAVLRTDPIPKTQELPPKVTKKYTESEAYQFLSDYFEYYKPDELYRNPRFRRVSNNVFNVALEMCSKKGDFKDDEFFWHSYVVRLTILSNQKYKLEMGGMPL